MSVRTVQGGGDYHKRDDYARRFHSHGAPLIAAIADGPIAPGATADVFLADSDFVATSETIPAMNDSLVTIPSGTKLYLGEVKPLAGLRIVQAFVCGG